MIQLTLLDDSAKSDGILDRVGKCWVIQLKLLDDSAEILGRFS